MRKDLDLIYSQMTDKEYLVAGAHSLFCAGIYTGGFGMPEVYTLRKDFAEFEVPGRIRYHYVSEESREFTRPDITFPQIIMLEPERALIDCIRYNMDFVDTGSFCEAMCRYMESEKEFNLKKLREVAEFYGVPWDSVWYWMVESEGMIQ